jgi:hypothetical protein
MKFYQPTYRINIMKKTVSVILFLIFISCSKPHVQTEVVRELDPMLISKEISDIVNIERQNRGRYRLKYDEKLAKVALIHSRNMVDQDFLSHEDQEKHTSQKRIELYYPEIFFEKAGENIGYSQGVPADMAARYLMANWMNSPDQKANILDDQYTHMGVGIKRDGSRYFGTINFISAIVKVPDGTIKEVAYGSENKLTFEFAGIFDRYDLSVYCKFPDKNAIYYTANNEFYTGIAPLTPEWIDHKTFSVTFKFDKGKGPYILQFGKEGNFYPRGYTVLAK